jgi:hypothetical protein
MKKINFLAVVFLLLTSSTIIGQTQNWQWAKGVGGANDAYGRNAATDTSGNVYVTGAFNTQIVFGTTTLTGAGNKDIFLVKYNNTGNVLWAKRAGGSNNDEAFGITTDKYGNVFVTGTFFSTTLAFGSTTLTNPGFFLTKYDPNGNLLWAKDAVGRSFGHTAGNCVATDTSGNVFVTGSYPAGNYSEIFVEKYNAIGNVIWTNYSTNSIGYCLGGGITTDMNGNVFITGYSTASTKFTSNAMWGLPGVFVVSYSNSGIFLWVSGANSGGSGSCGSGIAVDPSGIVSVTGWYSASFITFGPYTTNNAGVGTSDILLARFYTGNGNPAGVWSVGGSLDDQGYGMAKDASNNIYVTGMFRSTSLTFPVSNSLTNPQGGKDIFVAKYSGGFNFTSWAKSAGGMGDQISNGIAVDNLNNTFVTGEFAFSPVFDNDTLISTVGRNAFTAKLGCSPLRPNLINGSANICRNSIHNYSISNVSGATSYSWNLPSGWYGNSTSSNITATASINSGSILVMANNGCGNSIPQTLFVTVNPPTPTITVSGPAIFCQGSSVLLISSFSNSYLWSNGVTTQSTIILSTGNYSVNVTDVNGCSAPSSAVNVIVNPNPPVPSISQSSNILFSSAAAGNQWYLNGSQIAGAIGQVYIPTQNDTYKVCVMDGNGCVSCSAPYNFTNVGIIEHKIQRSISILPNPFSYEAIFRMDYLPNNATISIDNCFGQTVQQTKNISEQSIRISRENLPSGLYFVCVTEENQVIAIGKLVIEDK